ATVLSCTAAAVAALSTPAFAAPVKIAFMNSLSSTSSVGAKQARDGFALALKQLGEKFGGAETQVIWEDDEGKPDVAVTKSKTLIERDHVDAIVGFTFTNVAMAALKPIVDSKTFFISTNPGPSPIAGKRCSPYFFAVSYQMELESDVSGKYAQDSGLESAFLLAPDYQAGKDSLDGFKRFYKGKIVNEDYTALHQIDYSSDIARIAADKPAALFVFMPGAPGVNFVRQLRQAGLTDKLTFLSAFTIDEAALPALKNDAVGLYGGSDWAPNLDNPANKKFVAEFEKVYGYVPSNFAAHAYDAAMLIDSAVRAVHGDMTNKDAFRAALKKADFHSVRGEFKFNSNQFPIQNYYMVTAARRQDGNYETQIVKNVLPMQGDEYATQCPMK
ncbi:MAG: ABC transporter substrate-binding protein, partial [Xanthobacteraceae bacterium]